MLPGTPHRLPIKGLALALLIGAFLSGHAFAREEGATPFIITISGTKALTVPNGSEDNQLADFVLNNPDDRPAYVTLPSNVVIPDTANSITNPLKVGAQRKALLRLRWSRPIGVWWVETFFSAAQPPRPVDLITSGTALARSFQWQDPTNVATLSVRKGAITLALPGTEEYHPAWPQPTAPSIVSAPAFAKSLKGNWTLESKVQFDYGTLASAKTCGAIGVIFPSGRSIFAMFENGRAGHLVSLNHAPDNNLSIPFKDPDCYLRLTREGHRYIISYSSDGQTWDRGPATFSEPADPLSAFLGIGTWEGTTSVGYTFSYLALTPGKRAR